MGPTCSAEKSVQEDWSVSPPEVGTNRLRRNVGNYRPTLRNVPEEQRLKLLHVGSLKSQIGFFKIMCFFNVMMHHCGRSQLLLELTGFFLSNA
jgi:hypothetical protein